MLSDVLSDVLYKQCSLQVFIILIAGVICFWTISDQNKVMLFIFALTGLAEKLTGQGLAVPGRYSFMLALTSYESSLGAVCLILVSYL